jgi:hypothetical protein
MPNDADLLDLVLERAPAEAEHKRIFVDNPAGISCFDKAG